jgi:hypothetical protein
LRVAVLSPYVGHWNSILVEDIDLDLHRPECRDRVIRVLAQGVRCKMCAGPDQPISDHHLAWSPDGPECGVCGEIHRLPDPCPVAEDGECSEGFSIAPADMAWTRKLPVWQAAAVLGASVRRVATGQEPIKAILGGWKTAAKQTRGRSYHWGVYAVYPCALQFYPPIVRLSESGEWQAKQDAGWLSQGSALLDDNILRIPLTDGTVVEVVSP